MMTTQEIQKHIDAAMRARFEGLTTESGEVTTSADGDGRFLGKVAATLYQGLPGGRLVYLAIGESEAKVQIVKLGRSECLEPNGSDLDLIVSKEFGKLDSH